MLCVSRRVLSLYKPMAYSPELELIEQLILDPARLAMVEQLFGDRTRARRLIEIYARKGIVAVSHSKAIPVDAMPHWEIQQSLSNPSSWSEDVFVHLTAQGARLFDSGDWDQM